MENGQSDGQREGEGGGSLKVGAGALNGMDASYRSKTGQTGDGGGGRKRKSIDNNKNS